MSSHLYHSSMSLDHPVQSVFPSYKPGQSYDDFYQFSEDVPLEIELGNSLRKSIWPIGSRKWLGILAVDVSQHPG